VPYRRILEELLSRVKGATSALLLDAQGELVVGAGSLDERQRLIGAYAGISLGMALRGVEHQEAGRIRQLLWRHERGSVVLCPLKDGYYLVLSLGPHALLAAGVHHAEEAHRRLDEEI
jgi:predicted regulator of Ras-like GTPase activity (Roadblock/LC7/MglB family)